MCSQGVKVATVMWVAGQDVCPKSDDSGEGSGSKGRDITQFDFSVTNVTVFWR